MVSLAGVAFLIAGLIISAIALYAVFSIHWAWGVPFVFVGVICLLFAFVITLRE